MTPSEALAIEAHGAIKMNEAEVDIAAAGLRLAEINALGTPDFEALYDAAAVAKANAKFDAAANAVARAKARLSAYHVALQAAQATATFQRPRSGK